MNEYKENFTHFFHWFAWTVSLSASVIFLLFDVREDVLYVWHDHNFLLILFLLPLLVAIVGSVYAIFRKIPGGVLMIAGGVGMIGFYCFHAGLKEFPQMVVYGLPYVFPGVFFVFIRK